ncbi:hypothetical protein EGW08_018036, partial [Elysia chlorotica]
MQDSVRTYNPLRQAKGIGRRTGKVIQKKRNVNNGVENFEDYLSSDGDMTLNATDASSMKMIQNVTNDSNHTREKEAVLDLQSLPDPPANASNQMQKPASTLKISGVLKTAALPTRNSKFGRRTGRVIEKKRNIANGVDNFEDYLSSDGEMSLNITDASSVESRDNYGTISTRSSKKEKQALADISAPSLTETGASKLMQKSECSKEVSQCWKTAHLMTRNSRFGRRTGKDLLAGKDAADLKNFSNYFSDFNETGSLLPSPPQLSSSSQSADSRPSNTSSKPCLSEEENDIAAKGNQKLLEKSSDEEDPIRGLNLHQSSVDKRSTRSKTREPNNSQISSEEDLKNQSTESHHKKRSGRRSSLAVLAIRNSAKQKSFSGNAIGFEVCADPSQETKAIEIDDAQRNLPLETNSEVITPERQTLKTDGSGDSKTEKFNEGEPSEVIYNLQVDDSIYFKVTPGDKNSRKSLVESKSREKEISGNHLLEISHTLNNLKGQSQKQVDVSAALSLNAETNLEHRDSGFKRKILEKKKFAKKAALCMDKDARTGRDSNLNNSEGGISENYLEKRKTDVSS